MILVTFLRNLTFYNIFRHFLMLFDHLIYGFFTIFNIFRFFFILIDGFLFWIFFIRFCIKYIYMESRTNNLTYFVLFMKVSFDIFYHSLIITKNYEFFSFCLNLLQIFISLKCCFSFSFKFYSFFNRIAKKMFCYNIRPNRYIFQNITFWLMMIIFFTDLTFEFKLQRNTIVF